MRKIDLLEYGLSKDKFEACKTIIDNLTSSSCIMFCTPDAKAGSTYIYFKKSKDRVTIEISGFQKGRHIEIKIKYSITEFKDRSYDSLKEFMSLAGAFDA